VTTPTEATGAVLAAYPPRTQTFRRALLVMTSASLLVPVVGIVTSPVLAHALGVDGRGQVAAAIAPNVFIIGVATLGLPEALTFHLARAPRLTRRALLLALGFSVAVGLVCLVGAWSLLPFLSGGDAELGSLILLGTALAVPLLGVNLLRGAASGRQLWSLVAREKVLQSALRLAALLVLLATDRLTVVNAVLVMCVGPVVAGLVYWRLLLRPPDRGEEPSRPLAGSLLGFGGRVWLGSVSSMLLARLGLLLFTPLSDVSQLGLFVVAASIADVPLIAVTAIRDTLFGVNSADRDAGRITTTSRLTVLIALVTGIVLCVSLPWWIGFVFGSAFTAALVPAWILIGSAILSVPGFLAGAGLSAWGRPGLRSVALGLALVVNVPVFVLTVPSLGAVGGALAALGGAVVSTTFIVCASARVIGVSAADFFLLRRSDVRLLVLEARRLSDPRRRAVPSPGKQV
jgi:O-antigen/teichoic acid export membrane protein